jgi:hypothetical protein
MDERGKTTEYKGKHYPSWHGSPFDRGSADSYYQRGEFPHYWPEGTYKGKQVEEKDMTPAEIEAYQAGFAYNEELGDYKKWD